MRSIFVGDNSFRRAMVVLSVIVLSAVSGIGIAWAASVHHDASHLSAPRLAARNHGRVAVGLVAPAKMRARRVRRAVAGSGPNASVPPSGSGSTVIHLPSVPAGSVKARVQASALRDPVVSVGSTPTGVAVGSSTAYVANQSSNSVSVIDLTQSPPVVSATIAVGAQPDAAALSTDGSQLFVSNFKDGTLSIISTATNTVTHTVTVGSRPTGVLEVGGSVYVANLLSGTISVVNPSTGSGTGTISLPGAGTSTGVAPSGLAASADGHTLYVDDARNGKTYVIDLTQSPPAVAGNVTDGSFPAYLSVAGSTAYVASPGSDSISVLNLSASPPVLTGSVSVGTRPYGVVALGSLGEVFAANSGSNNLSVVDTSSSPGTSVSTAGVGSTPDAIALSPDDSTAVVSNEGDGTVSIFHVNQAPVNTVPGSQTVDANGSASAHNAVTFSSANSNLISTSDSDAGSNPVQITLSVSHGTLTLSGTSGLTFTSGSNGSASVTFTGALTAVNTALAGLTYQPATGFHGTDTLTLTDNDQGNTGLGKAESATSTVSISAVNVAPTVGNVSYTGAIGNTTFGVGTSPSSPSTSTSGTVLSNSTDANGDTLSAVAGTIATAHGGSVSMNSNGTFTYTPAVGFTGSDTFTFQVSDGTTTSSGTATITVANRVWYVNDNLSTNGNGTSTSPFNTLASVPGASGTGDFIFVYGSASTYTGGITLKASQTLVGQSVGLTIGGATVLSASGSNPTITNSSGIGITVASGNTIDGITVHGASSDGINGSQVNGFTLENSTVSGNGTPANVSVHNNDGLDFVGGLTGTVTISSSAITNSADSGFQVTDSSGSLNLTITGSTFSGGGSGLSNNLDPLVGAGVEVLADGTANATVSVTGSTFTNNQGYHFVLQPSTNDTTGSGTDSVTFNTNTLSNSTGAGNGGGVLIWGSGTSTTAFNVKSNSIQGAARDGIAITGDTSAHLSGTIDSNTVGSPSVSCSGSVQGSDIAATTRGASTATLAITNNKLYQYNNPAGISTINDQGSGAMNLTITGNTIADPVPVTVTCPTQGGPAGALWGLVLTSGGETGDTNVTCANISGNSMTGSSPSGAGGGIDDFEFDQTGNGIFRLPGYTGGSTDANAVVSFIQNQNTPSGGSPPSGDTFTQGTGGIFFDTTSCPTPS